MYVRVLEKQEPENYIREESSFLSKSKRYRLPIHVDVTQTFLSERLQKNSKISNEKPEAFVEETVTYFPFPVITSCHDVTDHEDADDISR